MNIQVELKRVSDNLLKKQYVIAEQICDRLLIQYEEAKEVAEILRMKSDVYNCQLDYEAALDLRLEIVNNMAPEVEDYYFVAFFQIKLGMYKKALSSLNSGIILTYDRQENYYLTELIFLKAYCLYMVGHYDQSLQELQNLDDDFKTWVEDPKKPLSKKELIEMISEKDKGDVGV